MLWQKYCYNDRLQLTGTELDSHATPYGVEVDCVQNSSNLITLNFNYGSANHNNGNIVGQTIGASATDIWQQYYTYDGTNRIAMASENAAITGSTCPGGATWCRKYGYDHFGNRWISASLDTLHMATPTAQSAVSLATNRLTSGTYDAAGNLTAQTYITTGGGSMAYDANNKATSFTATGVSVATKYDAGGRRVRKVYNSETTIWVYDAFGKLAAEHRNGGGPGLAASSPDKEFIYLGGTLVALLEGSEIYYPTTDHLGSTRLVTNSNGAVVKRQDFFPFGETIPASSSFGNRQNVIDGSIATYNASLSMRQQFTGQQRDAETGLDYFWARNIAPPLGRFLSMDPENAGAATSGPQGWNAYGYAANNPIRMYDPDGRCPVDIQTSTHYDSFGRPVGYEISMSGGGCFDGNSYEDPYSPVIPSSYWVILEGYNWGCQYDIYDPSCYADKEDPSDAGGSSAPPSSDTQFNSCMAEAGEWYSIPGFLDSVGIQTTGVDVGLRNDALINFVYGNQILDTLWGNADAQDAATLGLQGFGAFLDGAAPEPSTWKRRNATYISLNIPPTGERAPGGRVYVEYGQVYNDTNLPNFVRSGRIAKKALVYIGGGGGVVERLAFDAVLTGMAARRCNELSK